MHPKMTEAQRDLFIRAMQFACSSGTMHRYEGLQLHIHCKPEEKAAAIEAFAAFERGCGYSPEATIKLEKMTNEEFYQHVISYCKESRRNVA